MNARNRLYALWSQDRSNCQIDALMKLREARWNARYNSVRAVKETLQGILAALELVKKNDADAGSADQALSTRCSPKILSSCWLLGRKCDESATTSYQNSYRRQVTRIW